MVVLLHHPDGTEPPVATTRNRQKSTEEGVAFIRAIIQTGDQLHTIFCQSESYSRE